MSDRRRHRAFALSAVFVIAVCVLVWVFERPRSGGAEEASGTTRSRSPLVLGGEAPPASRPTAAAPTAAGQSQPAEGSLSAKAAILATARAFTAAFVRYEVGQLPIAVRRTIQSTATPSFASTLLSAPPSIPNGVRPPPPPRVQLVALANGPEAGQAAVAVELGAGAGEISTLTELLSQMGQEWRISALG